ncbi:hypothetical protein CY34DRAFT_811150 [Suillus luteus UH-Slu-Lm8-n1]|uniref:Uncharacterized protein n=1 Tax=Suillus luteus UH-Slu-Lm8-n1 TaxID=930992 RepID=A0A0D0AXL8_9AGAM|nr:hypothetical protein CY34DRAFT_811150 [Suillus luteus UH-Slu-Lm8-n1]
MLIRDYIRKPRSITMTTFAYHPPNPQAQGHTHHSFIQIRIRIFTQKQLIQS